MILIKPTSSSDSSQLPFCIWPSDLRLDSTISHSADIGMHMTAASLLRVHEVTAVYFLLGSIAPQDIEYIYS